MSNPGGKDFNVSPYYDDFDEDKKFVRILFRPGRAVQARELTQLQTIFQKQIERFGNFFFKDGAIVDGCEIGLDLNLSYVKLQPEYKGTVVDIADFFEREVIGANTGIKAYVGLTSELTTTDPKTLYINYTSSGTGVLTVNAIPSNLVIGNSIGNANASATIENYDASLLKIYVTNIAGTYDLLSPSAVPVTTLDANNITVTMAVTAAVDGRDLKEFSNNEVIFTENIASRFYANAASQYATSYEENGVKYTRGSKITIGDGVLYLAEHFVKHSEQTLILDKYKNVPSYKVGLIPTKETIDYIQDNTLVDNAQGTPNFQAPGADRFKIDTEMIALELDQETAETEFVSMVEIEDGIITKRKSFDADSKFEEILAKRTFEESGDYTLTNPKISVREHLIQGENGGRYTLGDGGNTNLLLLEVDPFTAYVKGFRSEFISKQGIEIEKGLSIQQVEQNKTQINYGNYIEVKELVGSWDLMNSTKVDLFKVPFNSISKRTFSSTTANTALNKIGEARIRSIDYVSGTPGTASAVYNLYLFDVVMTPGNSFQNVRGIHAATSPKKLADVVVDDQGNAVLKESSFNNVIFQLPYEAIRTIRDETNNIESGFSFKKEFDITFNTVGVATVSTGDNNETFIGTGTLSLSQKNENYLVIPTTTVFCSNVGGWTVTVATSSNVVTGVAGPTTFTQRFNVGDIVRIGGESHRIASISNNTSMILANTHTTGATALGIGKVLPAGMPVRLDGFGSGEAAERTAIVTIPGSTSITLDIKEATTSGFSAKFIGSLNRSNAREMKKTLYANTSVYIQANNHPSGLTGPYSLGRSDVYKIRGIYQSSSFGSVPTTANTDVTSLYTFDNGQRDNVYEHGTITPKIGTTPTGRLLVVFDYFSHDTTQGVGYMSVDSYPIDDVNETSTTINTADIPVFTSKTTGITYNLRNCLDFRLRKIDDTANTINPVDVGNFQVPVGGLHIPIPFSNFDADLSLYKGRMARLFLNEKGEFGVVNGSPGYPSPKVPSSVPGTLDLAVINIPPYPSEPKNVTIESQKNQRYTMREIGKIEDRVNRLEYYTSLNLLEKQATSISILDENGFDRFKNGILVDPFNGHNVADVDDADLKSSISRQEKFATAQVDLNQIPMVYNATASSGVVRTTGNKVMLSYTPASFSVNPTASYYINLTQGLVYDWTGVMNVYPSTDNWMDTTNYPDRNLIKDLDGTSDNWRKISNAWETELDSVQTRWVGVPVLQDAEKNKTSGRIFDTTSENQYETIASGVSLGPSEVKNQERIVDISVSHFMRSRDYVFSATGLKPYSKMYAFFDGVDVTSSCRMITVQSGKTVNDVFNLIGSNGFLTVSNTVYTQANTAGTLFANANGEISGYFRLPEKSFYTGQREFKLSDDAQNGANTTSSTKSLIIAQGTSLLSSGTQVNTRPSDVSFASSIEKTTIDKAITGDALVFRNPLSQSFFVDNVKYPQGIFVTSINLYFRTKSPNPNAKVYLQIREMENGLPTRKAIGGATTYVKASAITTSTIAANATTFTFDSPVYLLPGVEYCFSVIPEGNRDNFRVWISQLGEYDISNPLNKKRINKQPAAGTLFTSSNNYRWSVRANLDMKYEIMIAKFNAFTPGTAYLENKESNTSIDYSSFIANISEMRPDKTDIGIQTQLTDSSALLSNYISVNNLELVNMSSEKTLLTQSSETTNGVKSVKFKTSLVTQNPYISPVIDLERTQTILYKYGINSSTITTLTGTATYSLNANTVTGYGTAFTTEVSNGQYIKFGDTTRRVFSVTNNNHLVVSTNFLTSGSNVAIYAMDEENPSGPYTSQARYITRRVELPDGFEANDLEVYVDVNRPAGTDVKVYYKILNDSDSDIFDDKFYKEMNISGPVTFTEDPTQYVTEKYIAPLSVKTGGTYLLSGAVTVSNTTSTVTGTSTKFLEEVRIGNTIRVESDVKVVTAIANNTSLTVDSNFSASSSDSQIYKLLYNAIVYTTPDGRTYSGYKYFSIKVVFLSNNEAISPRIKKLKAISLT
jgi:hypothetical protein